MAQISPEGRYLRVNRKLCQMLGYSEHELLRLTLNDVIHPDDSELSAAKLISTFTGEPEEYSVEKRYVRKDGAIIWALVNWTVVLDAEGYTPVGHHHGDPAAVEIMGAAAESAVRCVAGRVVRHGDEWRAVGDPMEAALHCWALGLHRVGVPLSQPVGTAAATPRPGPDGAIPPSTADNAAPSGVISLRRPFTSDRMLSSVVVEGVSHVMGAPESVLRGCSSVPRGTSEALHGMASRGQRVLGVARGTWEPDRPPEDAEADLELLALVGLEDPPRPDVAEALELCRAAAIRVLMVTGVWSALMAQLQGVFTSVPLPL